VARRKDGFGWRRELARAGMLGGEEGVGICGRGEKEGGGEGRKGKNELQQESFGDLIERSRYVYVPALAAAKILSLSALLGVPCQAMTEGKGVEGGYESATIEGGEEERASIALNVRVRPRKEGKGVTCGGEKGGKAEGERLEEEGGSDGGKGPSKVTRGLRVFPLLRSVFRARSSSRFSIFDIQGRSVCIVNVRESENSRAKERGVGRA